MHSFICSGYCTQSRPSIYCLKKKTHDIINDNSVSSDGDLNEAALLSALPLADMWGFQETKETIIQKLERFNLTHARRIEIAHEHGIRQWFKPALSALIEREDALTAEEAVQIGFNLIVIVMRLREEKKGAHGQKPCPGHKTYMPYCTSCRESSEKSWIYSDLSYELKDVSEKERWED